MFAFMFMPLLALGVPSDSGLEPNEEIVVVAHADYEVYVAPIVVKNEAPHIEAVIGDNTVFRFTAMHKHNAKIQCHKGHRAYEPIGLNHEGFKVYDQSTIEYAWDDCDYKKDARKCSYQHNHYLLETYVTVDENQLVVEMLLFDPDMQVIATGSRTSNLKVTWIKQQEITTNVNESGIMPNQQVTSGANCDLQSGTCPSPGVTQNSGNYRREVQVNKPKEELPIRWEIPHMLLDSHIRQASLGLWTGVKIKL